MYSPQRRWFQVSLKSLFLLTLLAATFFGGYALALKQTEKERRRVEEDAQRQVEEARLQAEAARKEADEAARTFTW